jgi:alpha-1,2-mannosyltransferase
MRALNRTVTTSFEGLRLRFLNAGALTATSHGDEVGTVQADTAQRIASVALFGVLPSLLLLLAIGQHGVGWDFHAYYVGARAYLHGVSPYPAHTLAALSGKQEFVYPAPMAALLAPLALMPYSVALILWLVGSVAAIAVGIRILGVRDWRCYGALFLTHPVLESVRLGTVMPMLMLLLALLWRYRDRIMLAAILAALLAVSKVLLFPLLVWLAATRRFRAAALGAAFAAGTCLIGWLPLHLSSLTTYPALLHALASFEETFSYSLTSFVVGLGASSAAATAVAWSAGAALLALVVTAGRTDDFLGLRLALAASFVLSPIVWGHYYVLLIVPLAIRWPRFALVWLAAAWIRSDTLALPHAVIWAGLALVVLLVQLDLVKPFAGRALRVATPAVRTGALIVLVLLIPAAALATSAEGITRNAMLRPMFRRGSSNASGAATVRVDQPDRQICWRIWTENVRPHPAAIEINRKGLPAVLVLATRIESDGQASGCVRSTRSEVSAVRGLIRRPGIYRMVLAVRRVGELTGVFRRS